MNDSYFKYETFGSNGAVAEHSETDKMVLRNIWADAIINRQKLTSPLQHEQRSRFVGRTR